MCRLHLPFINQVNGLQAVVTMFIIVDCHWRLMMRKQETYCWYNAHIIDACIVSRESVWSKITQPLLIKKEDQQNILINTALITTRVHCEIVSSMTQLRERWKMIDHAKSIYHSLIGGTRDGSLNGPAGPQRWRGLNNIKPDPDLIPPKMVIFKSCAHI